MWWRDAVVQQIYIRSFADGDGDGVGDIAGIRSRLRYLRELGVDAIWITPWYPSPLLDGGYDVADYRDINPLFGSLADADALIADAHALGIKIITDLVPNHTSWDHVWFREAIAAPPGDPARARYHFRTGRGPDGADPPTNWQSVFGGSTWERTDDGEWYLHIFDVSQPDLNWANDEVRAEFDDVIRFWLDRGIDGLRIDVAHGMVKDPTWPDIADRSAMLDSVNADDHPFWDRPGVHDINRRWRSVLDEYDDRMMVAEAWVSSDRLQEYLRPDEYHQSFGFDLLAAPWDPAEWRETIHRCCTNAAAVGAAPTWVLSNHDVMRHATRYGLPDGVDWRRWPVEGPHDALDVELGRRRARAAALVLFALPGSAYVYQGDELGLPEVWGPSRRGARRSDMGALGPHRTRPRRLPSAASVERRRPVAGVRSRRVVAPAARSVRGAGGRSPGRRSRRSSVAVSAGDRASARASAQRRGADADRPRPGCRGVRAGLRCAVRREHGVDSRAPSGGRSPARVSALGRRRHRPRHNRVAPLRGRVVRGTVRSIEPTDHRLP